MSDQHYANFCRPKGGAGALGSEPWRRRSDAFHAAGHHVAAILCGAPQSPSCAHCLNGGVSPLEPMGQGANAVPVGRATQADADNVRRFPFNVAERIRLGHLIFQDGAGLAAEAKARRSGRYQCLFSRSVCDMAHAIACLEELGFKQERGFVQVGQIWDATAPLITRGRAWAAVETVAHAMWLGCEDLDELHAVGLKALPDAPREPLGSPLYPVELLTPSTRSIDRRPWSVPF